MYDMIQSNRYTKQLRDVRKTAHAKNGKGEICQLCVPTFQEGKRIGLKSRNVKGEMGWRYTDGYALI